MQFLILTTNGTVHLDDLTDTHGTLRRLQDHVGGYIQCLPLDYGFDAFVNEEGMINELPRNPLAESLFDWPGALHGNAVITGGSDQQGETVGLSDEQLTDLRAALAARGVDIAT